ncbi:cardiolipin synthase [Fundicoccus sp. Sow4_D5]|uniref:cardiolipin synthase n=1 Tax=Fundicoccus sp. Sow4_D5 TaxID=3438782 RepID=UPI003F924425
MKLPRPRTRSIKAALLMIIFIIQIVWLIITFNNLLAYSVWLNILLTLFSVGMILYLVIKNESPAYRMSWIILISLFPVFGGLFYFLFGNKRPARKMSKKIQEQVHKDLDKMYEVPNAKEALLEHDFRVGSLANYINNYANMPVYSNTDVEYFPSGESMMETLIRDLESAQNHIFVEFFIIEGGQMSDAIFNVLKKKAAEGVDVRLIYDDFGCLMRLPSNFDKQMEEIGIKALKFNPIKPNLTLAYNTRDHRKIIEIDSTIAYTGGLNLADEYINTIDRFGYWKDNMIRLQGPAIWNLTTLFLDMWNAFYPTDESYDKFINKEVRLQTNQLMDSKEAVLAKGFVQPFGDSPLDDEALGENVYRDILNIAQDYVYIYTPYLVISYELQQALTLAAKRGVDVRLLTPGTPDKKAVYRMTQSYYAPLLEAGVRIYEYTPGFLHAKTFVCDDKIASIGTINLDYRSLYLHFETSTMLYYHPVVDVIKQDFLESQAESQEIYLEDTRTNFLGELWDSFLRILAPFV